MPFVTYVCKNPTPHKTVVFVPATAMGSFSPGAGGGNAGGQAPAAAGAAQAIITCPKCAFTAQPGDGQMSSVANGTDSNRQEQSIVMPSVDPSAPPSNQPAPVAAGVAGAVAIPLNSPGQDTGGNLGALSGVAAPTYRLDSAGKKNLL
jgi:hypothetical protein